MLDRRQWLTGVGALGLANLAGGGVASAKTITLPFGHGEREIVQYPGKRPLIRLTARPPQLETPFAIFNEGVITPNDAYFVRYHLAGLPQAIDADNYKIAIGGKVNTPLNISLAELKAMEPQEYVAVTQCSGNSRGLFEPRVGGGQLANGAMGNARWKGVPLKALLDKAGVQAGAIQVTFDGLDGPVLPGTPDFVKALDLDHARDGEVMIAYQMNGADLPFLNGYPVRLVVPGWYGTYWVKHLSTITVIDSVFTGFWYKTAYRIPDNPAHAVAPGTAPAATVPINRMNVRSFITNIADGETVKAGRHHLRGIAFDGGAGIASVLVSTDGQKTWREAKLGTDLGKYSFREWTAEVSLPPGPCVLAVRAINNIGESQPSAPLWNPPGYMRNVVETVRVTAS